MRPVRISRALPKPLGQPADWDAEKNGHCGGLFIRIEAISGVQFMRSAWEAEPEEAGLLLAGGKMILGIAGDRHPVVHLQITELPEDFEPVVTARRIVDTGGNAGVQVDMVFAHEGGRRGMAKISLEGRTYGEAVAEGIRQIEELAVREGWVIA